DATALGDVLAAAPARRPPVHGPLPFRATVHRRGRPQATHRRGRRPWPRLTLVELTCVGSVLDRQPTHVLSSRAPSLLAPAVNRWAARLRRTQHSCSEVVLCPSE